MKLNIPVGRGSFVPCCYFPTLTLLIDDNARFLQGLQKFLGKDQNAMPFDNSVKVFDFISRLRDANNAPLYARLSLKEGDNNLTDTLIDVDIPGILEILQNSNRFEEFSVIIVDYAMPGMNGLEVSRKIKKETPAPIKVIMLTGEADENTAISAFNEGDIDRFIKKSAEDCLEKVKEYLADLCLKYFQDLSKTVKEAFRAKSNFVLEESEFINVFNKIVTENEIIEYYLIDDSGSFIMLDKSGNVTRLIVKTQEDMATLYEIALYDDDKTPGEILKKLENCTVLPYFPDKESELMPAKDWQLREAIHIKGKKDYYYTIIKGVKDYPLEIQNISSYSQYLKNKNNS